MIYVLGLLIFGHYTESIIHSFLATQFNGSSGVYSVLFIYCLFPLQTDLTIVASFDRRGKSIYTGNAKGKVLVMSSPELELVASFKVATSATAVKSIEFARRGE